jgi:hypothetical protein
LLSEISFGNDKDCVMFAFLRKKSVYFVGKIF